MRFASLSTAIVLASWVLASCESIKATESRSVGNDARSAAALPSSWEEFARRVEALGLLGTWTSRGTTPDLFAGIAAGLEYRLTYSFEFSDDRLSVFESHTMLLEDGRLLSTGAGVITWDDATGTVVATASGFDNGQRFVGESTLKAIDATTISFDHVERVGGSALEVVRGLRRLGPDRQESFVRVEGGGKAWITVLTRRPRG